MSIPPKYWYMLCGFNIALSLLSAMSGCLGWALSAGAVGVLDYYIAEGKNNDK